jgi:alpha/beta superfamily hydrolase
MAERSLRDIPGPAGRLEALLDEFERRAPRAAVVFAHPHPHVGGTLHTKAVYLEDFSASNVNPDERGR